MDSCTAALVRPRVAEQFVVTGVGKVAAATVAKEDSWYHWRHTATREEFS